MLEYALIIVWEMLENQGPYLEGREADLFSVLLRVRFCNKVNVCARSVSAGSRINTSQVLEATSTLRDALTSKIDPIYGLTTFHGCLRSFQAEQTTEDPEVKAATTAFGLIALGKFILRLPAEIAEEELPRLKGTLIAVCPISFDAKIWKADKSVMNRRLMIVRRWWFGNLQLLP